MALVHRNFDPSVGGEESGYTATHYVAPYAGGSGPGTSDDDTQSQSAYDAATTEESACTAACAALYGAGNVHEWAPGVYNFSKAGGRWDPSVKFVGSGTAQSPTIHYAKYPASANYGSTSLYTELRQNYGTAVAVMGPAEGVDWLIMDGFYVNELYVQARGNNGCAFVGHVSENCKMRRWAFDRYNHGYATDYNANCIYVDLSLNNVIEDCYFNGTVGTSHNNAAINIYNSNSFTIRYCTFEDTGVSIYFKDECVWVDGGCDSTGFEEFFPMGGSISYNRFIDCWNPVQLQQGDVEVSYNLMTGVSYTGVWHDGTENRDTRARNIHHNTIVLTSAATRGSYIEEQPDLANQMNYFRYNIIYGESGNNGEMHNVDVDNNITLWDWGDWTFDYNCYYVSGGGTIYFEDLDRTTDTGLSAWQTTTSGEVNSTNTDPEFSDAANDDYTLANNGQDAYGVMGCYITGNEEIGMRANPSY